ncbi:hypothetical protein H5410_057406 [Solanum commersonii]|uniref:Uncharacterized protein n=1 Tax=Solanum commersonii TaxID=4109 RepID=A0A9J5WQH5_SOLCO|nr:hypothetical protein H5410_057406 [Solanum commersonii]
MEAITIKKSKGEYWLKGMREMFLIWRNTCGSILGVKTSLYAEDLQITTEEQLCIFVWMYVYDPFGLMKTSLYRLELGL